MSNVSIVLPQRLSRKLKEKAEENDLLPEELAVEILFKGLGEESDPEELVEHYRALSEKYLDEAKEFLKKGDLVQASEKMWGATAHRNFYENEMDRKAVEVIAGNVEKLIVKLRKMI